MTSDTPKTETRVEGLTATQALGVALSVAAPVLSMNASQDAAPTMLDHLRRMGFDVVPRSPEPPHSETRSRWSGFENAGADALLDELAESPLPGARYAHDVVRRRLPAILRLAATPSLTAPRDVDAAREAELRAAVEALPGECHDGEGLGCDADPCVENVSRAAVLALLAPLGVA